MKKKKNLVLSAFYRRWSILYITITTLLLNGVTIGCSNPTIDNKKKTKMDKQMTNDFKIPSASSVENLSADLIPFISETKSSTLLVRVMNVQFAQETEEGIEMEVGILTIEVLEVFFSKDFVLGDIIGIPFKRAIDPSVRDRNSVNQWNNLPLTKGGLLVVAGLTDTPKVLKGQAGININTLEDPVISAIRQCYLIEGDKDIKEKHTLLQRALAGTEDILRYYTLDFLGRRSMLGRKAGAEIIGNAMISQNIIPQHKLDLGFYLTQNYFLKSELGADSTNQIVVTALAMILVKETDVEILSNAAQLLSSCVLDEFSPKKDTNKLIRSSLISGIHTPTPKQVTTVLHGLLTKVDEMERERIKDLLEAWQMSK